jgi:hypothetical protein
VVKEVQPTLARACAEPSEVVVADLRAEPVLPGVTRAGVVHRDPGGRLQAGAQYFTALGQEVVVTVDQQAHHLPFGDADADRLQLSHQPLDGDLPLMVLQQYEAA